MFPYLFCEYFVKAMLIILYIILYIFCDYCYATVAVLSCRGCVGLNTYYLFLHRKDLPSPDLNTTKTYFPNQKSGFPG